jgi:hypothetical protein
VEWTGWWKSRGGAWQPLCSGGNYDEAWCALLGEIHKGKTGE